MKKRIVIGLSGGVDSSVSALLLKKNGWNVHAVFLEIWTKDEYTPACTTDDDRKDAAKIAAQLDIPLHVVDKKGLYRREVLDDFFEEYGNGRTPNPDSRCNTFVKFPALFEIAESVGADAVATGHYAQIRDGALCKGDDPDKDQSYFLFGLKPTWLASIQFPVGGLAKRDVRLIAEENHLITSRKKDSQGLCFLGEIDVQSFLEQRMRRKPGPIVTVDGETIGEHDGAVFYTVGQRRGINVAADEPYYVVGRDLEENRLVVAKGANNEYLFHQALNATVTNSFVPQLPSRAYAKIRYRQPDQACTITLHGKKGHVVFDEPQRAITPGQNIVFYDDAGRVLGGGIIETPLVNDEKVR